MQQLNSSVLAEGGLFAESPRWHQGRLWFSEMTAGRVLALDAQGRIEEIFKVPAPMGLGWLPDGRLLVVSMAEYRVYCFDGRRLEPYCELSAACAGPPNDIVVDAAGRAYVGNMGVRDFLGGEKPKPADLISIAPGAIVTAAAPDLLFANGMAIPPDGRTLIVAETFAHRLTAFDVDPADGSLCRRRVFAHLEGRTPDGIALDAEGAVWVGSMETCEFLRVREGGEITHRIAPGRHCVSCALGGPDRRTLYMVTLERPAHFANVTEAMRNGATRARIEVAQAPAPGAGLP
ncbi:MAG: SMP-30/gluconolactonase/LRE family protein [Burkholderiales bacterium]|nr:SMP-30/gluconolactonase/LRE family protein [Burkholderiales bacterium]